MMKIPLVLEKRTFIIIIIISKNIHKFILEKNSEYNKFN